MDKRLTIYGKVDIDKHIQQLFLTSEKAVKRLCELSMANDHFNALFQMKFHQVGCDPLDHTRPLNLIEQLNQTFTYAASFKAAEYLFNHHTKLKSVVLNLGTRAGFDIETEDDGGIAAEVFASVSPQNNGKLKKDISKVAEANTNYRYVFYMCPDEQPGKQQYNVKDVSVEVVSLGCEI